jgi:predicted RNA-binding protein with PUA-like domain
MKKPNYFLAKTDPETFSIEDFAREKITHWDGVHNYQAINFIKQWQIGDLVYIYHSMGKAHIVGFAKVVTDPIKDINDKRNISWVADLELIKIYPESKQIGLKQIKESGLFNDWFLVKQSRLSVMDAPQEFVDWFERNTSNTLSS